MAALDPRARDQWPLALQPAQPVADRDRVPRSRDHPDLRRRLPRLPRPQPLRAQGRKAIRILAPCTVKQRDSAGEDTGETRIFFRTAPVFDVSMPEPLPGIEPVPLAPPAEPIEGDSHRHLITQQQQFGHELGYRVEIRELPDDGPGGWCDPKRRQIVVASGPANREVRTLVHELAHALGLGYGQYGREKAEVLVDCVTYVVCSSVGLDVGGESIPYVAGWGEDGALDAIREYAETIDTIARRIEEALDPAPDTQPPMTLGTQPYRHPSETSKRLRFGRGPAAGPDDRTTPPGDGLPA
jgi:hypothetical protein